jgi:hypothetical protein
MRYAPLPDSDIIDASWQVIGASVQGLTHIKRDMPCQDANQARVLPNHAVVVAVADGAGSASRSELGAVWATVTAVDWVAELLSQGWPSDDSEWNAMLGAALQTAHDNVRDLARKHHVPFRELATTLLLVVATPDLAAAIQVGDGATVVLTDNGSLVSLTAPQSGEYINETTFFTSPRYLEAAQFAIWRAKVKGVAVLTDGLQMLALRMPEGEPHRAFFMPLFDLVAGMDNQRETEKELRAFLRSDRIRQRADDDLTLVVASLPHPETAGGK